MKTNIPIVRLQIVKDNQVPYGEIKLDKPEKAAKAINDFLGNVDREHIVICCVDNCLKPTHIQIVGIGTINACLISIPEIFKTAILSNSYGLFLFHTHPSGEVKPSMEDIATTRRVKEAGNVLDILLQDHIILGAEGKYFSFRESEYWEDAA